YRTIVVNSNPATIMTDPGFADRTYLEPLDLEGVADVLRRERPSALLPTMGGQTALNLAMALSKEGVLAELGVELIGARADEFEREVVRDRNDNVVIVCSIENLDPMGVHTGDSVTVAPQMTLSDEAYQDLRDAATAVVREIGVDTGGSNIQFARERGTGEIRV